MASVFPLQQEIHPAVRMLLPVERARQAVLEEMKVVTSAKDQVDCSSTFNSSMFSYFCSLDPGDFFAKKMFLFLANCVWCLLANHRLNSKDKQHASSTNFVYNFWRFLLELRFAQWIGFCAHKFRAF